MAEIEDEERGRSGGAVGGRSVSQPARALQRSAKPRYQREVDIDGQAGFETVRADEYFRVIGFRVGDAMLTDAVKKDLDQRVIEPLRLRDEPDVKIVVVGTESHSKREDPRLQPGELGLQRADAVAAYMVEKRIPRAWITTLSEGNRRAPSSSSGPLVKADARGVEIHVRRSGRRVQSQQAGVKPVPKPGGRQVIELVVEVLRKNKGKPPDGVAGWAKLAEVLGEATAKYFNSLNASASNLVYMNSFNDGWASAIARLADDPDHKAQLRLSTLPPVDVATLQGERLQVNRNSPRDTARRMDAFFLAGARYAYEQVRGWPAEFEAHARELRARYPGLEERRKALREYARTHRIG
ncbi:MAG: OmpA family protein [Deltaproteobacteria bacterium]|nr:OmpA family protein [Nannocystaceae bacterium]